jgi:uncharacterized protein
MKYATAQCMPTAFYNTRGFLAAELLAFIIIMPLAAWLYLPPRWIIPFLWGMALVCYIATRKIDRTGQLGGWRWAAVNRANMVPILKRFAVCAVLMVAVTAAFKPNLLFNFIRDKPYIWALVMVAYPIISVIAQEIVYRRYMFARFGALISPRNLIILSGIAFGTAHLVFDNWVAPAMCVIGGIIFSTTYSKTRSLALVSLEHALYGNFLFTVGLGWYFYHGSIGTLQAQN